ncbi:YpbF family protein [Paenibacillus andongensis]|uniref:YpbF family protein n=1 Tax=Paenibacillus andongensis TaxID=2975482 RepID=UPI0021BA5A39|nr:YpbF family protein [Paenibacillus andongensis]
MQWPELNLSDDATKILHKLRDRKQEWDKLKNTQPLFAILTGGLILYFIISFYRKVIVVSGGNALAILDLLISNKLLSGSLLVCISLFLFTQNRVSRIEKAKTKYENLRIEVIEKFDASWLKDVKSESRDQISSFLDNEYDINIVYKSK